jgi:hypothetical protein
MGERVVTLSDIEEHETWKWVGEQLRRLEKLVVENGSDEEFLSVIEFLLDENDRWAVSQVAELEQSGALLLPEDQHDPH